MRVLSIVPLNFKVSYLIVFFLFFSFPFIEPNKPLPLVFFIPVRVGLWGESPMIYHREDDDTRDEIPIASFCSLSSGLILRMLIFGIFLSPSFSQPQPWSAPLSRELLVFNSFVRSLTRALRTLLEVTSLNMLLRNDARRARDDLLDIALSLPFQTEVNTGFGVLAKVYLDALTHINNGTRVRDANAPGVSVAKEMALDLCEETFPGVKNPKAEVERGFRFWDVVSLVFCRCIFWDGHCPWAAACLVLASCLSVSYTDLVGMGWEKGWLGWEDGLIVMRCDVAAATVHMLVDKISSLRVFPFFAFLLYFF